MIKINNFFLFYNKISSMSDFSNVNLNDNSRKIYFLFELMIKNKTFIAI